MPKQSIFKQVLTLTLLLLFTALPASACRVLIHVGHAFTATELLTAKGWEQVAKKADGAYTFDAWARTLDASQRDQVISHIKSRDLYVAEFVWNHKFIGKTKAAINPVLIPGRKAGFKNLWCMCYTEHHYGSTLSASQIEEVKRDYPGCKILTNFRVFDAKRFAAELREIDGMTYEFSVSDYLKPAPDHPKQSKLENICKAIRWCLDRHKSVFLLMPPGNNAPSKDNHYLNHMQAFLHALKTNLKLQYLNSDHLILVPATYDCRKRKVHNTPEMIGNTYANTGMGATLLAIDFRDRIRKEALK